MEELESLWYTVSPVTLNAAFNQPQYAAYE